MSGNSKITEIVKNQVRQRAKGLCEYCHAVEKWQYVLFTVDHVIPIAAGGTDDLENLALACFHCNRKKSNKTTAVDLEMGEEVRLFNPRKENWNEHFIWSVNGLLLIGLTAIGRATIAALDCNRERLINIRAADRVIGKHPPPDDPIASGILKYGVDSG